MEEQGSSFGSRPKLTKVSVDHPKHVAHPIQNVQKEFSLYLI